MSKAKNYHIVGLFFTVVGIVSSRINLLPDIVEGFCIGIGLVLQLVAAYAYRHDISGLRELKHKLLKSIIC